MRIGNAEYNCSCVRYVTVEQSDDNLSLIIGLSAGLGGLLLIIIIIIIISIIVTTCYKRRRRSKPAEQLAAAATAYRDNPEDNSGLNIELHEDDKYYSTIPAAAEVNDSHDLHQYYSRPLPVTPASDEEDTEQYSELKLPTPEPPSPTDSEPNSPYYLTLHGDDDTPVQDTSLSTAAEA